MINSINNIEVLKPIEFNGDFWHCNPSNYDSEYLHRVKKVFAKEIWEFDKQKNEHIRNYGYDILVIWESEYKKDKEATIKKCIAFLMNKNKKNKWN